MPEGAEKALRSLVFGLEHPAWDHWGFVWFQDGKFYEMVRQYHVHVATISGDSLEKVIEEVNDRFGNG